MLKRSLCENHEVCLPCPWCFFGRTDGPWRFCVANRGFSKATKKLFFSSTTYRRRFGHSSGRKVVLIHRLTLRILAACCWWEEPRKESLNKTRWSLPIYSNACPSICAILRQHSSGWWNIYLKNSNGTSDFAILTVLSSAPQHSLDVSHEHVRPPFDWIARNVLLAVMNCKYLATRLIPQAYGV